MKKILSVCVPTYNRPMELRRFLESFMPQMNDSLELVIGDDGDFSTTQSILNEFSNACVVHFKNPYGRGAVKNILAVTERASGDYIWWFGDDDMMMPGAIERTLKIVKIHPEIGFIWSNYVSFPRLDRPALDLGESRFFKHSTEVLEKVTTHLGFMSSIIFKKNLISQYTFLHHPLVNTGNFNLYIVILILTNNKINYYIREPGIINYPQTTGSCSYDPFQTFAIDFYLIMRSFDGKFRKEVIRKMIGDNFKRMWRAILVGRARGVTDLAPPGAARKLFKYYWSYFGFWIALPFLLMPQPLEKLCYKIFKFFSKLAARAISI